MVRALRLVALIATLVASSLSGAPSHVLFPSNLHLTREVQDPVSGSASKIEEYCSGNRVVSVTADRTVVVDYEKQEITEIDRKTGTFAIARFDEVAAVTMRDTPRKERWDVEKSGEERSRWRKTPVATADTKRAGSIETFEFADEDMTSGRKVRVGIDRTVTMTRDAVEVLIGAAYPNPSLSEHEPVLLAARESASRRRLDGDIAQTAIEATYGLPVVQSFIYRESGREVTFTTSVVRIGSEVVPQEVLLIPPGFRRVESRAAAGRRQLLDLDRLPASASQGH